jgi:hypothetical protein
VSAVFHGNAAFTGAVDARGPYSVEYRSANTKLRTCAQIAGDKSPGAIFVVPSPTTLDGNYVEVSATASPYEGPGIYRLGDLGRVEVRAQAKGSKTLDRYAAKPASPVRLEVKPDGSGSLTFADLTSSAGKTVSGSLTWTCS